MKFQRIFPVPSFIKIILISHVIGLSLQGSDFTCQVTNEANQSIPYVSAINITNDAWIIGNANGQINFPDQFHAGDTIKFQRIGYQSAFIVLSDTLNSFTFVLRSSPVQLNTVEVSGNTNQTGNKSFTQIKITPEMGLVESSKSLSVIPGIYIKTYGGPAGISSLSLDGAPSSHTNMYFAGFDLSNAQNGQTDISQLPASLINNICYTPDIDTGNPEQGNAEGSIEILPDWPETGFSGSIGSFGHHTLSVNLKTQSDYIYTNISVGTRSDAANYKVTNPINQEVSERKNNDFSQEYAVINSIIVLSKRFFGNIIALTTNQKRGVAGLVWSPTPDARRNDHLHMAGTKLGWTTHNGFGHLQVLLKNNWEKYHSPLYNIDTQHSLKTYQTQLKQHVDFGNKTGILFYSDATLDKISSADTENHARWSSKTLISVDQTISGHFILKPLISYNFSPDLFSSFDYESQLIYRFYDGNGNLSIGAGRFSHYPSFNDLYWEPGGNPDLRPEHTTKFTGGFTVKTENGFQFHSLFYYKNSKDLILWTPLQSYWQPKNIRQSIRKGYKVDLRWQLTQVPISFSIQYNSNNSRDMTPGDYYSKPLRYSPKYLSAATLAWTPGNFQIAGQLNYVSRRIAVYSWPEDQMLNAYTILGISMAYTFINRYGKLILTGAMDNLGNTDYETLFGYPEPPRSYRLTFSYQRR